MIMALSDWCIMMNGLVDYVKYDHIYLHSSNLKVYVYYKIMLGDYYVLVCVLLELIHGRSYLTIWVYNCIIDDDMEVYMMS